jgi:integrase/recombinase XerC
VGKPVKGLLPKGNKYAFQAAIPADCREAFGGKKKFSKTFDTTDLIHAERLAAEADREFKSKVLQIRQAAQNGETLDLNRHHQIVGFLFGAVFNAGRFDDDYLDMREKLASIIAEHREDGFPLMRGVHTEGIVFDEMVRQIEYMLEWSENSGFAKRTKPNRPESTLIGAHELWSKRAKHTQKTKDQYGKDVRDFTAWFEEKRGKCYGAKVTKRDVNQYVSWLMHRDAAKATINRALSALRLIYKVGQFSDDNPFSRVTDRMVIDGAQMKVRRLTDREVITLLGMDADPNVHMTLLVAAYSGMRLSEIATLKIENIEKVGRARVFNLFNAGKRKTNASYRKVPIHSTIWKELHTFIKGRVASDFILPDEPIDKYKNRSAALSKRVASVIDKLTTDPTVREHSLRHTFISKMAEAGIRKEWRMAVVGHEGEDVHDNYTHADFIAQLLEHVNKVEYVTVAG